MERPATLEWAAIILLALLVFPASILTYNHLGEDAFITFRYARNLAAGQGLVFNVGERVEGYSNLLWTLLMVPPEWLGIRQHVAARLLSMVFLAALVLAAWRVAFGIRAEQSPSWQRWWLPLAIWFEPLLRYHVDRGLETVSYASMIGALVLLIGGGASLLAASIVGALLVISRPEGIGFVIAVLPAVFLRVLADAGRLEAMKKAALFFLPALVTFAGQMAFRKLYHGEWLPNTVIAKRSGGPGGFAEIAALICSHAFVPLIGLLGSALALREQRLRALATATALTILAGFVFQLRAGGLMNAGFRYLAPVFVPSVIGVWLLLEAISSGWLRSSVGRRRPHAALLLAVPLLAIVAVLLHVPKSRLFIGNKDAPESHFGKRLFQMSTWRPAERIDWFLRDPIFINAGVGRWLKENLAADAVFALDQMGQAGYYAGDGQTIIDLVGLMDAHIARKGASVEYLLGRGVRHVVVESRAEDPYWPRAQRLQPSVPALAQMVGSDEFRRNFAPHWILKMPGDFMKVVFIVYGPTGETSGPAREFIVGPGREEFEQLWRVRFPEY